MNVTTAKDELLGRVFAIDPEQFEQFCKILVEEIEYLASCTHESIDLTSTPTR